jgi:hypothetical protein
MDKKQRRKLRKELFMAELLKRDGYTERNLYKKENRVPIKVMKIFYQNVTQRNNLSGSECDMLLYVTRSYSNEIPDNIILVVGRDGKRYLFEKEDDITGGLEKNLLCSKGPLHITKDIPHILLKHEMKEGLETIYM